MFDHLQLSITYFEPCDLVGTDDADLRAASAANWRSRGWTPIELHREDADRHTLAQPFEDCIRHLPTVNWPEFDWASFRRYLALATWFQDNPSAAYVCFHDWDLFNRKLSPGDLLPSAAANGITLLTGQNPECYGALLLNRHAASVLPLLIMEVCPRPELTLHLADGRKHMSDYIFLGWLLRWSHLAGELVCQQLFDPMLLDDTREAMAMRASAAPLIHVSNAASRFNPHRPIPRAAAFAALSSFWP
jgi:hypothetical protein